MISFLRKIRKRLLAENRFTRYLLYAVGEVILVVIGILIALQINNWNENRKTRIREAYYIDQLLRDFQFNHSIAEWYIAYNGIQLKNTGLLLKAYKVPLTKNEEKQWYFALSHTWFLPHRNYSRNTWNELQNTGSIGIISNKAIVQNLAAFYSDLKNREDLEEEWGTFNFQFRKKVNGVLEHEMRTKVLQYTGDTVVGNNNLELPAIDPYLEKMKKIEGLEGLISDIHINRDFGYEMVHKDLRDQIDDLIVQLSNERKRLAND
ncbi:hypothetical protein GCM10023115_28480 [Pontixanthobacter gangjinensis]|uniref:Uncharacterized protein n=1 Tax=Christiangramia aestuarii TaxID=1028746 RepID=A0A7K1LNG4_9FLAO|nr:DUF6090 family protein [Christiangramia aestuarii]MUP42080.1 hypothetical protein [Christiangramia aestuarii]